MTTSLDKDRILTVTLRGEYGYEQALLGLSFNKDQTQDMVPVLQRLAPMDGGHNKSLESIQLWLEVRASRYWWQEADTYRCGSTKQSQSSMHTISKRPLTQSDFCMDIPDQWLSLLNTFIADGGRKNKRVIKGLLPESFMQKRLWNINYKTLRNIILQRQNHELVEWQIFIQSVLQQVSHPELLPGDSALLEQKIEQRLEVTW